MEHTPEQKEPARMYPVSDSVCLVADATIADSAIERQAEFENEDSTLTKGYLNELRKRIDNAASEILGADNAAALREASIRLTEEHDAAAVDLGFTKDLIQEKYATLTARRDELLNILGFKSFYARAVKGRQDAMGELLSRVNQNMTAAIEDELMQKGLPTARIGRLRRYAATYINTNTTQEGRKDSRKELSAADVATLNALYREIMVLCRLGKRLYKNKPAIRGRFVFKNVAANQVSYHTGGEKENPQGAPKA